MTERCRLRCGVVGAGRSRNGLGPFLASHFEAAGGLVVAVSGRDSDRAGAAADELARRLGHAVQGHAGVPQLLTEELDALIIAAPVPAHLPALEAALGSGVAVLCEKPLVAPEQGALVAPLLDQYLLAGQLLVENCQWPEVLPAWRGLHPGQVGEPLRQLTMRLAPGGSDGMLADSLSHFLSLVQALTRIDAATTVTRLRVVDTAAGSAAPAGRIYRFELGAATGPVACHLELRPCAEQPRPAWFAINGARADRQIDLPSYRMSLRCDDRSISIGDPSAALVYRFAEHVREASSDERVRTESDSIRHRARIYHSLLEGLAGAG